MKTKIERHNEYVKEITLILFAFLLSGCGIPERTPCYHNLPPPECKRHYDWECCYLSGITYARGGCPDRAVSEFQAAIKQNPKDRWKARTYGMHFLDYFPHREIGIVYLRQGRKKEAVDELSKSLATADSARARYYLNEANKLWLKETGVDTTPPYIIFPGSFFDQNYDQYDQNNVIYTPQSSYLIEAVAGDDYFVSQIIIDGERLFFDLARPSITFKKRVHLSPGENVIHFWVSDLAENHYNTDLRIVLDQQGPVVLFVPISHEDITLGPEGTMVRLKGIVYDAAGVERFIMAGEEFPIRYGEKILEFEKRVPLYSKAAFCAWDRAGNATKGELDYLWNPSQDISSSLPGEKRGCSSRILPILAKEDPGGPIIHLEPCPSIVYEPFVVITGWVKSSREILNVSINEESILSREEAEALIPLFRRIFHKYRSYIYGDKIRFSFTRTIPLKEAGKNSITIYAQDSQKISPLKRVWVEYKVSEIQKIGRRWALAILPFDIVKEGDPPIFTPPAPGSIEYISEKIRAAFFNTGRFRLMERERIDAVMHELNLTYGCRIDPNTALQIGKGIGAEVLLAGSFYEHWEGQNRCLEIYARLIDVETQDILGIKNIYNHWKEQEDIDFLSKGISQGFVEEFPLMQGEILKIYDDTLLIDLGIEEGIKRGMKIWVYRSEEAGQMSRKGMHSGDVKIIGEGRIEEVQSGEALVLPGDKSALSRFRVGDLVIMK